MTDVAITEGLQPVAPVDIIWNARERLPFHPNGMKFTAIDAEGHHYDEWTVFSVGGGADRWTPWRTEANQQLRGDLYPTHGMGPACQLLDIHRTDWIETLVSMDTEPFLRKDFRNGDHTTTLMRTRLGKTILLQHNVVDPHEYTRRYHVVGTLKSVESSDSTPHDQMSRRMDRRLVHCLHQGLPLDIDVYDLAEWCAVSELSRLSIENGNVPVAFPDFTRSKIW